MSIGLTAGSQKLVNNVTTFAEKISTSQLLGIHNATIQVFDSIFTSHIVKAHITKQQSRENIEMKDINS